MFSDEKFSFRFEIPDGWRMSRGIFEPIARLALGRRTRLVHEDGSYVCVRVFDPGEPVDYSTVRKTHAMYFDRNRHLLRSSWKDFMYNDVEFHQIVYKNQNTGGECCSIHLTNGRFIFAIELAAVSWSSLQAGLRALDAIMTTWHFA